MTTMLSSLFVAQATARGAGVEAGFGSRPELTTTRHRSGVDRQQTRKEDLDTKVGKRISGRKYFITIHRSHRRISMMDFRRDFEYIFFPPSNKNNTCAFNTQI